MSIGQRVSAGKLEWNSPFVTEKILWASPRTEPEARTSLLAARSVFDRPWAESDALSEDALAFEEQGIIAGDDRKPVKNTTDVPWRWICRINIEDSRGRPLPGGTGFLVSDRHVLTAAHVVYEVYKNMHQHTVTVTPALHKLDEPFGSYGIASAPRIRAEYDPAKDDRYDWDYALLTLTKEVGKKSFSSLSGQPLCYWGSPTCGQNTVFARLDPKTLNGKRVSTAGYPSGKGGKQLWHATGILHSVKRENRTMGTTADTTQGQSGSPVWIVENGRYCLAGIAVGAGVDTNTVVRVTRELVRQVRQWIEADGDTPSMSEELGFERAEAYQVRPVTSRDGRQDEIVTVDEFVPLTLPPGAPNLPSDAKMFGELKAMGTAKSRPLATAFAAFGDYGRLVNLIPAAVNAVFEPLRTPEPKLLPYLARLGAEAFVYGIHLDRDTRFQGWADHPDHLRDMLTAGAQEKFVHFAIRRLNAIAPVVTKPETHQRHLRCAAALFRFVQNELGRDYRLVVASEAQLRDYRTLLVQLIWRHHQGLVDGWLASAAKSRLSDQVTKQWDEALRTAAITRVDDDHAKVLAFRLTSKVYRDYFKPDAASDFPYSHYTSSPPPSTGEGPELKFSTALRRRAEQKAFVEQLGAESGASALPKLHDSASWQAWVLKLWQQPLLRREDKLEFVLRLISGYFTAFTIHAPHDLAEGCRQPNYLTRTFPRAVSGSLVHDCLVYALRWLHILGGLLSAGSRPAEIDNPRVFLIEMPAHVGAMIRLDRRGLTNKHLVVGINNKSYAVPELDAGESDDEAAKIVVRDMYGRMRTPFRVHPLRSSPASAAALWSEVCKLAASKLTLPYGDPTYPPHLRYLAHNARVAAISRDLADAVRASWMKLHQALDAAKRNSGTVPAERLRAEIQRHAADSGKGMAAALARIDSETGPLIKEIEQDLAANEKRIAKGVLFSEGTPLNPLFGPVDAYRRALAKASQSLDLRSIQPDAFFSDNDFVAAIE